MLEFKVILHRGEIDAGMRMKVHVEMTQGFCFERPELIQKQKEIVQRVLRLATHVEGHAPLHDFNGRPSLTDSVSLIQSHAA